MSAPESSARPRSKRELFLTFAKLALQGFGGVLAIVQRVLCEEKRWLSRSEFVETLAVAQVLPGPNVCNVSLMVGDRFFGLGGAAVALAGMLVAPAIVVLALASLEAQFTSEPALQGALRGIAATTAGLVLGTAIKLASTLGQLGTAHAAHARRDHLRRAVSALLAVSTFVAVGWLRLPLLWVLPLLGLVSWAYALRELRRATPQLRPEQNGTPP